MIQAHGLRTSQGCGRPRHVSAPEPCAPRHTPRRRDAANSLSSSTVPPLAFLRARVSSTEPRPHQDCDKPDKPCRRHRRETPVYRIKIKRSHSAGAANTVQHLSSPETRRCFPPTMARTIAMLRPLCFAKWDKIFYFSGQQWLGVPDRFTNCRVRDGDRHGDAGVALLGAVDVDCDVDRGCSRSRLTFSFPYLLPSSLATVVPMSGSHICHLRCVRAYGRQTRRGIDAWSVSRLTGLLADRHPPMES